VLGRFASIGARRVKATVQQDQSEEKRFNVKNPDAENADTVAAMEFTRVVKPTTEVSEVDNARKVDKETKH